MIGNFISEVKNRGLARSNRFEMFVPFPTTSTSITSRIGLLFCEATSLPGMTISTATYRFYGEPREMPYERTFDPITVTFYVDTKLDMRRQFEQWMGAIINPTSRTVQYHDSYVRPLYIRALDLNNNAQYEMTLYEAYPKAIDAIPLNQGSRDVMRINVTFAYKYWEPTITEQRVRELFPRESQQDPQSIRTGNGYTLSTYVNADSQTFDVYGGR